MNFNQEPGIYDAINDKLIINFSDALDQGVFGLDDTNVINNFKNPENIFYDKSLPYKIEKYLRKPYYIILPEYINEIFNYCFGYCDNLVGMSGKGVKYIGSKAFCGSSILEEIDFPNLERISGFPFEDCDKLKEKFINENNLIILNDNILISAYDYNEEKLIIPNKIAVIEESFLMGNKFVKEVVFPLKMKSCNAGFIKPLKKVILPIEFDSFHCYFNLFDIDVFYKGGKRRFDEFISKKIFNETQSKVIKCEPYTIEELSETNYSIKEIEYILDRKLNLDELLKLNYSMKDANDYFKQGDNHEL